MRRWEWELLVWWLFLLVGVASGQQQPPSPLTALPSGTWLATPMLAINYINSGSLTVTNATLAVDSVTGSFKFYGTFTTGRGTTVQAVFAGDAACADGTTSKILFSVIASTCSASSPEINWFCQVAPKEYSGVFSFGTSSPSETLIIDRWGGALWPFVFACAHEPCSYTSACNDTLTIQTLLYLTDSNLLLNGTELVIFQAGSSTNNTVTIQGDTVTVAGSELTLQQSNSSTSTTVNLGGESTTNEITFVTQNSTMYNFYTTAPASCRGYAAVSAARSSNLTLSTTAFTRVTFTSSSIDSPGGDWSLSPDSSTLRFLGASDADAKYAYELKGCVNLALLYSPTSKGVSVLLQLYNSTAGASSPLLGLQVQSVVIYNHTNPALLTTVCAFFLMSGLYTDNLFSIYASLETTDLSVYSAAVGLSTWSLTAVPLSCKGEEVNININATFNDTQLEAVRECYILSSSWEGAMWPLHH
jgi:hypothetical protein